MEHIYILTVVFFRYILQIFKIDKEEELASPSFIAARKKTVVYGDLCSF